MVFRFNGPGASICLRQVGRFDQRRDASVWEKPEEVVEMGGFARESAVTDAISKVSRTISGARKWGGVLLIFLRTRAYSFIRSLYFKLSK